MPFEDTLYDTYKDDGYYWIIAWTDTVASQTAWLTTKGYNLTDSYCDTLGVVDTYCTAFTGSTNGIPQNALLDRDGDVRKYGIGAVDGSPYNTEWTNAVKELLGVS
jgi:hypothetical protein